MDYYRRMLGGRRATRCCNSPRLFRRRTWACSCRTASAPIGRRGRIRGRSRAGNRCVHRRTSGELSGVPAVLSISDGRGGAVSDRISGDPKSWCSVRAGRNRTRGLPGRIRIAAAGGFPQPASPLEPHPAIGVRPSSGAATSACLPRSVGNLNRPLDNPLRPGSRAASLVGFAVLGGIFGEGIDLVGDRLMARWWWAWGCRNWRWSAT